MQKYFINNKLKTIFSSIIGIALLFALDLPLPFLFGPMFACLLLALLGQKLEGLGQISIAARAVLGVAIGASVTPDLIHMLPTMLGSIVLVLIYTILVCMIGMPYFYFLCKLDSMTSYYSAVPGGLQDMVLFGKEAGGDVRALSLIHTTRLIVIIALAPIILTQFYNASLDNPVGLSVEEIPVSEVIFMLMAGLIGWKGGQKLGLFGAAIIGPMILATIFSLSGLVEHRPPKESILIAQALIGSGIGVCYVGITIRELRNIVFYGLGYVIIIIGLAALFAILVVWLGWGEVIDAFLAFSPGGQAEMALLAIIVGADLSYVISHHLARLLLVTSGAPIAVRLIKTFSKPRD